MFTAFVETNSGTGLPDNREERSDELDRRNLGDGKMALGLNYGSAGGDFLPILKYDARAGRFFRVDKENGESTSVDITRNIKFVADFENVEVGFIMFPPGAAPQFHMVPLGTPLPAKPGPDFKQGVRLLVKLGAESGGDVREIASSAAAFLRGIDALHSAYEAGKAANPGKLPVVVCADTLPIESGSGAKKSTNYTPVFEITAWAPRPKDLEPKPRGGGDPMADTQPAPRAAPPSTGSTRAAPPPARQAALVEDDFG